MALVVYMAESQASVRNPERQINLQLITFSVSIGLVAFASALMFVFQGHYPFSKFMKIACVVFIIGTPMVFAPAFLMLRNYVLNVMSPSQLMEVVLSTRVMKRFGIMILTFPVLLLVYITLLEESLRGTWVTQAVQIALALLFTWSFTLIQIHEVRRYEQQHDQEKTAKLREYSLGKFLLKLLPSLLSYLAASLLFFAGLFCAISQRGNLYAIVGVLASAVFFFLGRRSARRLAAQFVDPPPAAQIS